MKKRGAVALLALSLGGCGVSGSPGGMLRSAAEGATFDAQAVPGEAIVHVKAGARLTAPYSVAETLDFGEDGKFMLVKTAPGQIGALSQALSGNPDVLGVSPNKRVKLVVPAAQPGLPERVVPASNDPLYGQQWYLPRVGADKAWGASKGKGVLAAIVDTGIDYDHPDLKANIADKGKSFVGGKDGKDLFGHGTHVAGTVAAAFNNGQGVAGVAPEAALLPVTVLGADGSGSLFGIAGGIKFAADWGAERKFKTVINLSLGGPAAADPISTAAGWYATRKGALLVAATGNDNGPVGTPARITKYFMAVSATNQSDTKASFSNFGPEVAIGAPGVDIMNTTPTYKVPLNDHGYALNYASLRGTSMATPVVAGVAALLWAKNPQLTNVQVREKLEKTAKDLGTPGKDVQFGNGLVQAAAALGL